MKRKTGTREWAESNYNIGVGCSHNCLYCYARTNALKFKWVDSTESWIDEKLKDKMPPTTKKKGIVMFPTAHDITPFYLDSSLKSLKALLSNGNKVLIVSKPHMVCVEAMCKELLPWKNNILFRFTIGTNDETRAKFWEPGAPSIIERFYCLRYAYDKGFATSVSMEPILGTVEETFDMFKVMEPFVTDTIWVGKMNRIDTRVKKSSVMIEAACKEVAEMQNDKNIMWLVKTLKGNPKVSWKDSIKEVIERNGIKNE